jgi:hypothetical protein
MRSAISVRRKVIARDAFPACFPCPPFPSCFHSDLYASYALELILENIHLDCWLAGLPALLALLAARWPFTLHAFTVVNTLPTSLN